MSKGFMIYAYNNEQFDYFKQAVFTADNISKHLDKPVTIVTDKESVQNRTTRYNIVFRESEAKGKRNLAEQGTVAIGTWKNANRNTAYELSPYDETIVIDSDYLVMTDRLNLLFDMKFYEFLCFREVFDVANKGTFDNNETFGQFKMPHFWATVMYFKKSKHAESIFNNIAMVKEYYKFFSDLYKFDNSLYRNDYALSIALLIQYGHRIDSVPSIPWKMFMTGMDTKVKSVKGMADTLDIRYNINKDGKDIPKRMIMSGNDVHVLDKFSLEEIINDRDIYNSF